MSMNNHSTVNEQLISQIMQNVTIRSPRKRLTCLYWTIINNSILRSVSFYDIRIKLTDEDAIQHHGSDVKTLQKRYPAATSNVAKALKVLRKHLPYKTAKALVSDPDNLRSDTLYHAINDFKFECNSNFHTLFNLTRADR